MTGFRSARLVYRLLLALHPSAFRERFGKEMLWIFDQTVSETGVRLVLADGVVSLAKQWMATDTVPRVAADSFVSVPVNSLSAVHVTQATVIAAAVMLGFLKLLTQSVPLPQPPKDFPTRRASWVISRARHPNPLHRSDAAGCDVLR